MPSKYPRFHRYVNRVYIGLVLILAVALPLCHLFTDELSISGIIIIFIALLVSYAIYWLTVRTNCYGERTDQPTTREMAIAPTAAQPQNDSSAQSAHSRGSSNSHISTNPPYTTFANYRLGGMRDRLRRWASNNGARPEDEEAETTATEEVANPPPTYSVALEGAGLPPPYTTGSDTSESVAIVVDDGSNNNTSRRTASVSSTSSSRSPTSWFFGFTSSKSASSPSSQRNSPTNLLAPPPAFTSGSTPVPQATSTQPSTQSSQSNPSSDRIPSPHRAPPAPPQSPNNQSPS